MRRARGSLAIVLCAVGVGCRGDSPTSAEPPPVITFRSTSSGMIDTIDSRPTASITVNVSDSKGRATPGAAVRFAVLADPLWPRDPALRLVGAPNDTLVTVPTSASGTAAASVQLGSRSGAAGVVVTVDKVPGADTIRFTVLPGQPAKMQIVDREVMATVGASYRSTVSVTDRVGNAVTSGIQLTTVVPCQVNGSSIISASVVRCNVDVRAGSLADSIGLTFVPDARIVVTAGYNGATIATMKLDGSELHAVGALGGTLMDNRHPVRGPNGLFAGVDVGPDIKTHIAIIDGTGSSRLVPVSMPIGSEQNWPRLSPDGQWVYFSGCDWTVYEACRVWRTHLDGSSPSILTPSQSSYGNRSNRVGLTPDGRTLIYGDHAMLVHVLDIVSGADRSLGVTGILMSLDPTGTRVAFVGEDYKLRIINLDGTGLRDVPTALTFVNFLAPLEWTSDGAWVVAEPWQSGNGGTLIGSSVALVNVSNGAAVGLHYRVPVGEFVTDR